MSQNECSWCHKPLDGDRDDLDSLCAGCHHVVTNQDRGDLPDVRVSGGGTVYLVHPVTQAAKDWIQEHVGGESQYLGDALAVEHRYVRDLVAGMQADGLVVR